MNRLSLIGLGLAAVAMGMLASAALGALWEAGHMGNKLTDAQVQVGVYKSADEAKQRVIEHIKAQQAERLVQLRAQRDKANSAMQERDRLQAKNTTLHRDLVEALRKAEHENPSCQSMATVGLCPAVDRRLFPEAAASSHPPGNH